MQLFQVTIGPKNAPRLQFECIAPDSCTAFEQHADLAEPLERVEIKALRTVAESVLWRTAAAWLPGSAA